MLQRNRLRINLAELINVFTQEADKLLVKNTLYLDEIESCFEDKIFSK